MPLPHLPQVKTMHDTEKMSSSDQIARLFRPGAKYFNMNPFEVLGLPHTATVDDVKRAYRRMSVQVRARLPPRRVDGHHVSAASRLAVLAARCPVQLRPHPQNSSPPRRAAVGR